jgi:hypothetical protein
MNLRHNRALSGRQAAREMLLLGTTAGLSPEAAERLELLIAGNVDWQYLFDLTALYNVTPLIAQNLMGRNFHGRIPQMYTNRLNERYNSNLYKNIILSGELSRILSAFQQHDIPVIPLKGTVLAELLYGNPAMRVILDTDILVRPEALSPARSLLNELGYRQLQKSPKEPPHPFHDAPFFKNGPFPMLLELHWNLADEKLLTVPRDEIWRRAQTVSLSWGSPLVLSPEDTLLYMSVQLSTEVYQLRLLGDIAEVLKKYRDALDWDYIVRSAYSWRIPGVVYYSLRLAGDLLGAPVPPDPLRRVKPGAFRSFLLDFLAKKDILAMPIRWEKLREETMSLVHALMMPQLYQTRQILSKYRGTGQCMPWLRTFFWMVIVSSAALVRNVTRAVFRRFY